MLSISVRFTLENIFDIIILTHFINPIIQMREVVSQSIATDLGGYVNVHSAPLIVTMDNAAFSVMLTREIRQSPVVC